YRAAGGDGPAAADDRAANGFRTALLAAGAATGAAARAHPPAAWRYRHQYRAGLAAVSVLVQPAAAAGSTPLPRGPGVVLRRTCHCTDGGCPSQLWRRHAQDRAGAVGIAGGVPLAEPSSIEGANCDVEAAGSRKEAVGGDACVVGGIVSGNGLCGLGRTAGQ